MAILRSNSDMSNFRSKTRAEKILSILSLVFFGIAFVMVVVFMFFIFTSSFSYDLESDINYMHYVGLGGGLWLFSVSVVLGAVERTMRIKRLRKQANQPVYTETKNTNDIFKMTVAGEKSMCPQCLHINSKQAMYCEKCGAKL